MAEVNKVQYFNSLTGIRAIAAYMVYLHHSNSLIRNTFGVPIASFTKELHIGVTLFFVLSGFLIAYRYMDYEKINFRNYMVNRFSRIYPMYFIFTTLTFIAYAYLKNNFNFNNLFLYLLNITFLRGFFRDTIFSGISQGWTLTVEETFYVLAPLIFIGLKKNKLNILTYPIILFSFGVILVLFSSKDTFLGFFGSLEFMVNGTFFGRCSEFFIGVGLSIYLKKRKIVSEFKYYTYLGILVILACVYLLSVVKGNLSSGILQPYGMFINTLVLPLFGISLLYYGLITENTPISRILGSKFFVLLGKSSYIFYLIHVGLIHSILYKCTGNELFVFVLLNIISILFFLYLEKPLNTYFRKKLTSEN